MEILEKLEFISKHLNEDTFVYTTKNDKFKKKSFVKNDIYFSMYMKEVNNKFMNVFSQNVSKALTTTNMLNADNYNANKIENKLINGVKPFDSIINNLSKVKYYNLNDLELELIQLTEDEVPNFLASVVINVNFKPNPKILSDMLDDWNSSSEDSDWTYSDVIDELESKALDDIEAVFKNKIKNVKRMEISKNGRNTDKEFDIIIEIEYLIK